MQTRPPLHWESCRYRSHVCSTAHARSPEIHAVPRAQAINGCTSHSLDGDWELCASGWVRTSGATGAPLPFARPPWSGADESGPFPPPLALRARSCAQVPRTFHANYACTWRSYVYLLPLTDADLRALSDGVGPPNNPPAYVTPQAGEDTDSSGGAPCISSTAAIDTDNSFNEDQPVLTAEQRTQGAQVLAASVDEMLARVTGREVDFYAYGRSTPQGKSTVCTLLRSSAHVVWVPAEPGSVPVDGALGCASARAVRLYAGCLRSVSDILIANKVE